MSQSTDKIETFLVKWRWNHVVPPLYAGYMVIIGLGLIFIPHRYEHVQSWVELFDLFPAWLWGVLYVTIGGFVLYKDTPIAILIQAGFMIFEGVYTILTSIQNEAVSPTVGLRALTIGIAFWIIAIHDISTGGGQATPGKPRE